jgi:hypothetical protein
MEWCGEPAFWFSKNEAFGRICPPEGYFDSCEIGIYGRYMFILSPHSPLETQRKQAGRNFLRPKVGSNQLLSLCVLYPFSFRYSF